MADEATSMELSQNIEAVEFKVYNRVAATKPVKQLLGLLIPGEGTTAGRLLPDPEAEAETEADDGDDPSGGEGAAYLHVATAARAEVFGIRLGFHVADTDHVLVVDAAVEYEWSKEVTDYADTDIEEFIKVDAVPRVAVGAWTVIEELARSVGAELNSDLSVPIKGIAGTVLAQVRAKTRKETTLL